MSVEPYSPDDSNLHLSLPHDHANSVYSTSPLTYKLDHEFDFAEIRVPGDEAKVLTALDVDTVSAIVWAITRTKQVINRATNGRGTDPLQARNVILTTHLVPSVAVQARIPDYMYQNLGMERPRLATLLESVSINPLRNIGDREVLHRLFQGLQQLGREAIAWIQEARWRSRLLGERSMWNWDDPRVLRPLEPFIRDPRLLSIPAPAPLAITFEEEGTPGANAPPNSPSSPTLPFLTGSGTPATEGGDASMLLQLVLHPTNSRYAQRYPLFNLFDGEALIDNGYVDDNLDAMDVDEE